MAGSPLIAVQSESVGLRSAPSGRASAIPMSDASTGEPVLVRAAPVTTVAG